jgi:Fe-S cluster biogenesis protein NfuA
MIKSPKQFQSVETIIAKLRPAMQADGGDVELVSVEDGIIYVRLQGTCLACPSSNLTVKHGIERTLKEHLPWVVEVVRVP